jgi:hypothetical protein
MGFKELHTPVVMIVVRVDVGVEGTGVDEDCYWVTSSRRISSIRTETL